MRGHSCWHSLGEHALRRLAISGRRYAIRRPVVQCGTAPRLRLLFLMCFCPLVSSSPKRARVEAGPSRGAEAGGEGEGGSRASDGRFQARRQQCRTAQRGTAVRMARSAGGMGAERTSFKASRSRDMFWLRTHWVGMSPGRCAERDAVAF